MAKRIERLWGVALGLGLSLALLAGCGTAGQPTAVSAFYQFGQGGGGAGAGGGGTGGGQFIAVAYDDALLYGAPYQGSTTPTELNVVCELFQSAADYVLLERDAGSGGAFQVSAAQPNVQIGAGGVLWTDTLPTSDKEYKVEAQDGSGQAFGESNLIATDIVGGKGTFTIQNPITGPWLDYNNLQNPILTPPAGPAPTSIDYDPAGQSYVIWCVEIRPTVSGIGTGGYPNISSGSKFNFLALATGASFDVQSGTYVFGPSGNAAFTSGTEYLLMVVACDGATGWGTATTIDLFNPNFPGPYNSAFLVQ